MSVAGELEPWLNILMDKPLNPCERIAIICVLAEGGIPADKACEFADVVRQGIESGEEDATAFRSNLLSAAATMDRQGIYGAIARSMLDISNLADSIRTHELAAANINELIKVLDAKPKGRIAARIMIPRLQEAVRNLVA